MSIQLTSLSDTGVGCRRNNNGDAFNNLHVADVRRIHLAFVRWVESEVIVKELNAVTQTSHNMISCELVYKRLCR